MKYIFVLLFFKNSGSVNVERLYNQKVLVIGVEVGRERHTAVGLTPDGRRYGHFDFPNDGEGFRKSLNEVMKWKVERGMERVLFVPD